MKNILFVCTGNTCRSPFAAYYFNKKAAERGLTYKSRSAGLFAAEGESPSIYAVSAAQQFGVSSEMKVHKARSITSEDILCSDYIFTLGENHLLMLEPKVKLINAERKDGKNTQIFVLGNGISDPYGGDAEIYRACYLRITKCVDAVIDRLVQTDG